MYKILVADDEQNIRELIKKYAKYEGFDVDDASNGLEVIENSMAVVPTDGENEVFCYEFLCKTADGQRMLVYIDAASGEEENMLILIEDETGILTM